MFEVLKTNAIVLDENLLNLVPCSNEYQLFILKSILQVDSVIQETKNLMNEIAKLVTACFVCATKVGNNHQWVF